MRIAQVAPLWEQVPPPAYGGTELVVSLLTEELVSRGHDVTLFASGDSKTSAKLESVHPRALRLDTTVKDPNIYDMLNMSRVYENADRFDIIHSHVGCVALPYTNLVKTPTVHTLHGIFTPDNEKLFTHVRTQPFISISNSQRDDSLGLNYVSTIYNGIDTSTYKFHPQPERPAYLAFLGRISPEKGAHLAIEIAKRSGWHLKMAGKVDAVDLEYFETQILPHLGDKQIEFLGEADHQQKSVLMGGAVATLFPITWKEPFGLVMIESMVTGTPVIAMNLGSVSEVIAHGKSGFLCRSVDECIDAIASAEKLDRFLCREHVLLNFTAKRMADGYEAVYQKIIGSAYSRNGQKRDLVMQ
ncbi:glycosyltransferase family 4 protein [Pseudanabaena sp. FACHB-1998]|uniref:glycosyltransferase family 4 protein n=1 Tax=Pseudanabaena sp. FACHB-1998 TaxID=2692858 RepID=UPI001681BA37|nr:glycosyltransferase family 4 protein [Pseudanabaena sp. FACHB-1998]MBD2178639.1 glycosyltransferase family 4 protein [Pseudanabaena sp. FACHB-1998]